MAKKEVKTDSKNTYFKEIKEEMKKVKWPTKKEMLKYSISTIGFVIIFALYFFGIEALFALIKGLIK